MGVLNNRIDDLVPEVAAMCRAFLAKCDAAGLPVAINETRRNRALQLAYAVQGIYPLNEVNDYRRELGLWALSETENQRRATWTLSSYHLTGRAFDAVPLKDGKPWWNAPADLWEQMGEIGESVGLTWGGRWKNKDSPHFEKR